MPSAPSRPTCLATFHPLLHQASQCLSLFCDSCSFGRNLSHNRIQSLPVNTLAGCVLSNLFVLQNYSFVIRSDLSYNNINNVSSLNFYTGLFFNGGADMAQMFVFLPFLLLSRSKCVVSQSFVGFQPRDVRLSSQQHNSRSVCFILCVFLSLPLILFLVPFFCCLICVQIPGIP